MHGSHVTQSPAESVFGIDVKVPGLINILIWLRLLLHLLVMLIQIAYDKQGTVFCLGLGFSKASHRQSQMLSWVSV
jgi:hypothetical protein